MVELQLFATDDADEVTVCSTELAVVVFSVGVELLWLVDDWEDDGVLGLAGLWEASPKENKKQF